MMSAPSRFLVFDSRTGPDTEDGGVIYCATTHNKVHWPPSVRRGRPRKDEASPGRSLRPVVKKGKGPSGNSYAFVNYSPGHRTDNADVRKTVRTHVMHNYQRQKRGLLEMGGDGHDPSSEEALQLEKSIVLRKERWGRDPFDSFPIEMLPYMHELLYFYVSVAAEYLYPIEANWGLNPTRNFWVPLALTDPVLLSSALFASQQLEAQLDGKNERPSAIKHLAKAFQTLNARLQDPLQNASDTTIAAVAGLALSEQSSDNHVNWRIHMRGLKQMVDMRGGLCSFEQIPMLHDKLCRADTAGSVHYLSMPYFQMVPRNIAPGVSRSCEQVSRTLSPGFQAVHDDIEFDPFLLHVLCRLHTISQDMDTSKPPKSEIIPLALRKTIRSVQYDLLTMLSSSSCNIKEVSDQLHVACGLGILLYVGTIQNEVWVLPKSERFMGQLKLCLGAEAFTTNSACSMRLWLLFLGTRFVFDPMERLWYISSVIETISQLSLLNWHDTRSLLQTFAWTGKVQDISGKELWDEAMGIRHE